MLSEKSSGACHDHWPNAEQFPCLRVAPSVEPSKGLSAKFFHEAADLFVLLVDFTETLFGSFGICSEGDSQDIHPVKIVFGADFFYLVDDFEITRRWLHAKLR
jgi:hypothetical protein